MQNVSGENVLHISVRECNFPIAEALISHINDKKSKDVVTKLVNQQNKVS